MKKVMSLLIVLVLVFTMIPAVSAAEALTITEQPQSIVAKSGDHLSFHVGVNKTNVTYQWYGRRDETRSWNFASGSGQKTAWLSVDVTGIYPTYQYMCVVKDRKTGEKVQSDIVTVTVPEPAQLGFTKQTTATKTPVNVGETIDLYCWTTGAWRYQWYYYTTPGGTPKLLQSMGGYISGYNTYKATIEITEKNASYTYALRIYSLDNASNMYSDELTLVKYEPLAIVTPPQDITAQADETVQFTIGATGVKTYQWYYRTSSTGTTKLATEADGAKTATLNVVAAERRNGYQYYCRITDYDGNKIDSDWVTLTIAPAQTPLEITAQPADQTAVAGNNAEFTVAANGDELKYQWQTNASGEWADIADATAATLSVVAAEENAGAQYRCVITDKHGETATSEAAALTVEYPQGHKNNPHMITLNRVPYACETGVVADGATYYASINNGSATPNLVIENADVNVIYNGETFKPVDGVVTVPLASTLRNPNNVQIVNVGAEATAYTLNFSMPVGTMENPLVIEDITSAEAVLKEGDVDGYEMVWTAPEAGLVQLSASSSVWNGEFGVTVTHGVKQYNLPDDADAETGNVNIMVEEGDVLFFTAALICEYEIDEYWDIVYDEDGNPVVKTYNPAGYVYISAVYETGTEVYPYTISGEAMPGTVTTLNTIKPGESAFYRIGGSGGVTLTVEDENTVINYNGVAYAPVNGVITIELAEITWWDDSENIIEIVNKGTEAKAYDLTFAYPVGHMSNPAELIIGENAAVVEAGSTGYFYTWTAEQDGTLIISMNCDNWSYAVNNLTSWAYGTRQEYGAMGANHAYAIAVAAGDKIQVSVNTYNPEGDAPAGTLAFTAEFTTAAAGTEQNPLRITDWEDVYDEETWEYVKTSTEVTVPAGATMYFGADLTDLMLTVNGVEINVPSDGIFTITNDGEADATYELVIVPVITEDITNPDDGEA